MYGMFERHDRYNFEAKINYTLDPRQSKNKYFLTFYFFVPKSLNATRRNYSKNDFYTDMHTYIRFQNPRFTLAELLDKCNTRSPLCQITGNIENLRRDASSKQINHKLIYEFRMFGTIFRASVKGEVFNFIRTIRQEDKTGSKNLDRELDEFLTKLREIDRQFESLERDLDIPGTSRELQETYTFARDLVSLELQNNLTLLLSVYRKRRGKQTRKTVDAFISLIENNRIQRRSRNSHLIRQEESLNEDFTYWEGILKKYFQGVLYLTVRDKDTRGKAQHLLYGIAAGIAMFLSILLGYWIGMRFSNEQSTSFIVAIVVAYIIKDRTKDIIRNYSNTILRRFFPDHKFVIEDPLSGRSIGTVRESMRFLFPRQVPEEVLRERSSGHMTRVEKEGKPEEVFVYEKEVVIDTEKVSKRHTRHRDINDIIRFNVRKLIQYADDSFHFDKLWDSRAKKIKRIKCAKVYHLNLIIRLEILAAPREKKQIVFKHVRVILNQEGIVRTSEV
jgi:hypothetical protein